MAKKAARASKSDVSKSQAIRDYLKANRGAKRQAVVDALKAQGIDVSAQTVSTVKFNMKKKKGGKAKRKTAAESAANGNAEMVSLSDLLDAKKLVSKVGGIEKVKLALQALSKLN